MSGIVIELPFPPGTLSGHHDAHWRKLQPVKKKHREWARLATVATWGDGGYDIDGDIRVSVTFYPPDRRGDRTNYPNRMKPYWDGIADALKVNDRRFLPSYHFAEPVKDARVVVVIGQ
jgi:crossover junction endodeoxyribonuclease RusA